MNYGVLRRQVPGPLSVSECEALAECAAKTTATRALEVGHYMGLSTAILLGSLPARCEFVTIDHHQGDAWVPASPVAEFESNVAPFVGDRKFQSINEDMVTALPSLDGGFGFVFYDADHSESAVRDFWHLTVNLLAPRCTLVFDDADWTEQSTLRGLAQSDGFNVATSKEFVRTERDKHDPNTYTLEIMERRRGA